jgi:hypothetical protein
MHLEAGTFFLVRHVSRILVKFVLFPVVSFQRCLNEVEPKSFCHFFVVLNLQSSLDKTGR